MKKKCTMCGLTKTLEEFYVDNDMRDKRKSNCKLCDRKRVRNYYKRNLTKVRQYARDYYNEHREQCLETSKKDRVKKYQLVLDAKNRPCADCGQTFPAYVMDLDHVRGEKSFALGQCGGISEEVIKKEIEKCDAVCANCHRIRTYQRNQRKAA